MPGANEPAVDDGGIGDTSGMAALDDDNVSDAPGVNRGLAKNEHYATVMNNDPSNFTIKSDSNRILSVERRVVVAPDEVIEKDEPVIFTISRDSREVLSLCKRPNDEKSTVTGDSGTGAGNKGKSG